MPAGRVNPRSLRPMSTEDSWRGRRFHFVGVGGSGMSGLAIACAAVGADVTGSDRTEGSPLQRVRASGIPVTIGHAPDNVPDDAELVYSTAVKPGNVERVRAREL